MNLILEFISFFLIEVWLCINVYETELVVRQVLNNFRIEFLYFTTSKEKNVLGVELNFCIKLQL